MVKYRVVELTEEALKAQCTTDDYEDNTKLNDELQRATPFSQQGLIVWALVEDNGSSNLVAGQTVLYCHCESHRFDCVVRRNFGEIKWGCSHHIGSVFTLPEHRNRGLAKLFMTEVAKQLRELPGALVSVLYSDIGPTYYDNLGWKLYPSKMATLDVEHPKIAQIDSENSAGFVSLTLDEKLDEFIQADNARLVEELKSDKFEGQGAFAVLPSRDSIEWQFCIGVHFAQVRKYDELPSRCGVAVSKDAFLIWCHNLKGSTLYIVRARLPTAGEDAAETTRVLLAEALKEARRFKLNKVVIWDPASILADRAVRDHLEVAFVDREDSLSSAMMFHGDSSSSTGLPYWLANEKFAWV